MIQSIEEGRKEDGNLSIADKIIKKLEELKMTISNNYGRWAWELLQNAKDSVADIDKKVSVYIEYENNKVTFSHTGDYFTEKDIRGLINQITSKEVEHQSDSNKVGRFGTGFITTHILSEIIDVEGIVKTNNGKFFNFKFPLDREGDKAFILAPKIEHTWKEFHKSTNEINSIDENKYNTLFSYPLATDRQHEIAKKGIEEFSRLIPFVLSFIPKIDKVTIRVDNQNTVFQRTPNFQDNVIVKVDKRKNEGIENFQIAIFSDELSSVALEIDPKTNAVKPLDDIPKLFCEFPLIGTEKFYFPAIINSFYFHPQTERNGIWLKEDSQSKVIENKKILENSILLYQKLLTYLSETNVKALYYAINTEIPKVDTAHFDEKWYAEKIQNVLRELIVTIPIVDTVRHGRVPLDLGEGGYVDIPSHAEAEKRNKLWTLGKRMSNELILPLQSESDFWYHTEFSKDYSLDLETLASFFSSFYKNVEEFKNKSGIENEFEWLNEFYGFILSENQTNLFDKYAIVPNHYNHFSFINSTRRSSLNNIVSTPLLFNDDVQDETLLDIYQFLEFNERRNFVSEKVIQPVTTNKKVKVYIANKIINFIKNLKENTEESNKAIRLLMEWLDHNPEEGKELFTELYRKRAELFMQTITDKESLYSLMKSETPLNKLFEIAQAIENDPDILRLIENKKQEKIQEKRRNEAGEYIEELLKKAFEARGFKVEKKIYGKDLVISLSNTNKSIDIEVKSTNTTGSVYMTSFQADTAIQRRENYFLCVVKLENEQMIKESVMSNSVFVQNIGSFLQEKYNQIQSFDSKKSDLEQEEKGIGISIENMSSYRYKVSYSIWREGISFDEFISLFIF